MKIKKSEIIVIACALAAFGVLTFLVMTNDAIGFDEDVRHFFYSLRCGWLTVLAKVITQLGSVLAVTAACVILLIIPRTRIKVGIPVAAAVSLSQILRITAKGVVERPRPPVADRLVHETSHSFPSGHAVSSLVLYGLLIIIVRRYVKNRALKNLLTIILAIPAIFIGVSRVYLGVHYPTDVLGGWALGVAIIAGAIILLDKINEEEKKRMKIYGNVSELIGKTPLLKLGRFGADRNPAGNVFAKLEYFNPAGSVKDRVGKTMIEEAEKAGKLKEGATIIEPTSGNTGIGIAAMAASRGYKAIIIMPDTMSIERRQLLAAYGAEIILTPGAEGMAACITKAEEIQAKTPGSIIAGQFVNPDNPKAHYTSTGPEIWEDTDGKVDIFVATVGTGGTLTGTARYLKEKNPDIKVVAVEPFESPLLSKGQAGPHAIQGIGANFVPDILDTEIYDEIIAVKGDDAFEAANEMAKKEGILVGISSGAALCAAFEVAARPENEGKNIVVILPDTGERYLSANVFK